MRTLPLRERIEQEYGRLHSRQRAAVDSVLGDYFGDDFFVLPIVDGPPGTGKTHTGTVAAGKYVLNDPTSNKVLYTAFTNFALDKAKEALESLGFPAHDVVRLLPSPGLRDWPNGRIGCRWDLLDLSFYDIRRLQDVPFILCTPYMLGRMEKLGTKRKIIIDEFSQIDVPTFVMILNKMKKSNPDGFALLGDPLQLPVVTTQEDLHENIVRFMRTKKTFDSHVLQVQHRMHHTICEAVNNMRRELAPSLSLSQPQDLVSSSQARRRGMMELGYKWNRREASEFEQELDPAYPLVIYNTDGPDHERTSSTGSTLNEWEAGIAARIAREAHKSYSKDGVHLSPVVITPYSAQVYQIKKDLPDQLKSAVTTVYRFQGREHPFVVVSLVRNNPRGNIGFLEMPMLRGQGYVAVSRAKAKMIVLMSKNTFSAHPIFEALARTKASDCLKVGW